MAKDSNSSALSSDEIPPLLQGGTPEHITDTRQDSYPTSQESLPRYPDDKKYQNLTEPPPDLSTIDNINFWFLEQFLGITGQWTAKDVIAPNRLRTNFPHRLGGMGFTTLGDVIPDDSHVPIHPSLTSRQMTETTKGDWSWEFDFHHSGQGVIGSL